MSTSPVQALLDANTTWANAIHKADPDFFAASARGQRPQVLWIGCADSRVPESVITGARPGDLFVHRNIANQFHPEDDSARAVLAFALGALGIEHVVVAGHSHCGGAMAALEAATAKREGVDVETPLGRWLAPLTSLARSLDLADNPDTAVDMIVAENVKRQVENICHAEPVKRAWAEGKPVWVHGWVYDVGSGRIRDLNVSRGPST